MAAVIFDFDGTLADTFPLVVDISYELSGARRLPAKQIDALRALPLLEAVRLGLGVSRWALPRLTLLTRPRMYSRMHEVALFAGIPEMLKALRADGHTLYIVTSNRKRNVRAFLEAYQLDKYFDGIGTVLFGSVFYKVRGLRLLVRRKKLVPADCVYVGNEALDVHAAQRVGMRTVAVTWSGHSRSALEVTRPDAVVDQPAELPKVVRQWKQ
ncbi:MAG TPA: HAD hydrolase-like protein [Candidatus Saccharimonadales bacterium]|nr:HAD hydrolase-like protein [Candidatus Saccharimonadales bacterium]